MNANSATSVAATVDLSFRLTGTSIPADHGYALYSALCRILPQLHGTGDGMNAGPTAPPGAADGSLWRTLGVHPINGALTGDRRLAVTDRSRLTIRLPADRIGETLVLCGKALSLGSDRVLVGVPRPFALRPAARLFSRLVIIKGFTEAEPFLAAITRQMGILGIDGRTALPLRRSGGTNRSPHLRRTLRVRDKEVVGYAVEVSELSAEDSIGLQESGLGGRRRFGCGIFVPAADEPA